MEIESLVVGSNKTFYGIKREDNGLAWFDGYKPSSRCRRPDELHAVVFDPVWQLYPVFRFTDIDDAKAAVKELQQREKVQ